MVSIRVSKARCSGLSPEFRAMEILKQDLLWSHQAVKALQEGSELWKWHDNRIRYLIELLYGEMQTKTREGLYRPTGHVRQIAKHKDR